MEKDFFNLITKNFVEKNKGVYMLKKMFSIEESSFEVSFYFFNSPFKMTKFDKDYFWIFFKQNKCSSIKFSRTKGIEKSFLKEPRFLSAKNRVYKIEFEKENSIRGLRVPYENSYMLNSYDKKFRELSRAIVRKVLETDMLKGFPEARTKKLSRSIYQFL